MTSSTARRRSLPAVVKQLGAVSLFNDFASEMVYPLLPALITTRLGGGAVALGHPPGMTGARLILTALYALHERGERYAVASQCAGGGNGMATLIKVWED